MRVDHWQHVSLSIIYSIVYDNVYVRWQESSDDNNRSTYWDTPESVFVANSYLIKYRIKLQSETRDRKYINKQLAVMVAIDFSITKTSQIEIYVRMQL